MTRMGLSLFNVTHFKNHTQFFTLASRARGQARFLSSKQNTEPGKDETGAQSADKASQAFTEAANAMDNVDRGANEIKLGFNKAATAMATLSLSFRGIESRLTNFEQRTASLETVVLPGVQTRITAFETATNKRLDALQKRFEEQTNKIRNSTGAIFFALLIIGVYLNHTKYGRKFIRWVIGEGAINEMREEIAKDRSHDIQKALKALQASEHEHNTQRVDGETLKESISLEIQRLQTKYSSSLSGSWFFSPLSRGYSHWLKLQALMALRKEIISNEKEGRPIVSNISEETMIMLKSAYHFDTSPESEDEEFKNVILTQRSGLTV